MTAYMPTVHSKNLCDCTEVGGGEGGGGGGGGGGRGGGGGGGEGGGGEGGGRFCNTASPRSWS